MLQGRPRQAVKNLLVQSRIRLVYSRIIHTRYTQWYFYISGITCLCLCALQAVILVDNTRAVDILVKAVDAAEPVPHITVRGDGHLHVCSGIPKDVQDSMCVFLGLNFDGSQLQSGRPVRRSAKFRRQALPETSEDSEESDDESSESEDDEGEASDDEDDDALESARIIGATPSGTSTSSSATPTDTPQSSTAVSTTAGSEISSPSPPPATLATTTSSSSTSAPSTTSTALETPTSDTAASSTPSPTGSSTSTTTSNEPTISESSTTAPESSEEASSTPVPVLTASDSSTSSSTSSATSTVVESSTSTVLTPSTATQSASTDEGAASSSSPASDLPTASQTRVDTENSPMTAVQPSKTRAAEQAGPTGVSASNRTGISMSQSASSPHSMQCIYSLSWLEEVLHDSQREDVATIFFHLWTFGISFVAILNGSIPHLGAAFLAHALSAAWSSTRIQESLSLAKFYRETIVKGPCQNADLLGGWWELRLAHTIPLVVLNTIALLMLGALSWKLFRNYAGTAFSNVGTSPVVQRAYKLVLFFSVALQLASFFAAVSIGLWIAKAGHGSWKSLAEHGNVYLAAFIVMLLSVIPWMVFGWVFVRKESKEQFIAFLGLSVVLLGISSVMFGSNLYRTIFKSWRLFAVVAVTGFLLLVLTTALGIWCCFNFGKGLSEYLQIQETPDGHDFTPVQFPRGDPEKGLRHVPVSQDLFSGYELNAEKESDLERFSAPPRQPPTPPLPIDLHEQRETSVSRGKKVHSVWSIDTSDQPALPSPARMPNVLKKASPNAANFPFDTTIARPRSNSSSLVPFQGLPYPPPVTPSSAVPSHQHTRGSFSADSTRSMALKRTPFPLAPHGRSSTSQPMMPAPSRTFDEEIQAMAPVSRRQSTETFVSVLGNYYEKPEVRPIPRTYRGSLSSSEGGLW